MGLERTYYPHSIRLPSPEITHFSSVSPSMNYSIAMQSVAGQAAPCFVGVSNANPAIEFTTQQLKSVLDTCTTSALCKDLSGGTVELYYRAGKPMEIREDIATAVHARAQLAASAMLYWSGINVTQGEVAEISASLVTAKRGVAEPLVWTGDVALPAVAGCQNLYGLGPCYLNDTLMTGVTGVSINNNVQLEPVRSDGEKTNTYIGIRSFHPQVELQTNDLDEITGATFGGDEFTTLVVYLRRMISAGIYDDTANSTHIKLTFHGGLKTVDRVTGTPAATNPMFHTVQSNVHLTHEVDTASSIT